jgi:hypothetical protein
MRHEADASAVPSNKQIDSAKMIFPKNLDILIKPSLYIVYYAKITEPHERRHGNFGLKKWDD